MKSETSKKCAYKLVASQIRPPAQRLVRSDSDGMQSERGGKVRDRDVSKAVQTDDDTRYRFESAQGSSLNTCSKEKGKAEDSSAAGQTGESQRQPILRMHPPLHPGPNSSMYLASCHRRACTIESRSLIPRKHHDASTLHMSATSIFLSR